MVPWKTSVGRCSTKPAGATDWMLVGLEFSVLKLSVKCPGDVKLGLRTQADNINVQLTQFAAACTFCDYDSG